MAIDPLTREEEVALTFLCDTTVKVFEYQGIDGELMVDCPQCNKRHNVTEESISFAKCLRCEAQFRLDWSGV